MNKAIIVTLFITITSLSHGMETIVLHNEDILSHLTQQICNVHNFAIKTTNEIEEIKKGIVFFSWTDKALHEYYNREKTHQNIVRHVALYNNKSDNTIASAFGYMKVVKVLDYLFYDYIPQDFKPQAFTEYLKDTWYLNATSSLRNNEGQETLLLRVLRKNNYEKAKTVITAKIDCHSRRCKDNPITLLSSTDLRDKDCIQVITMLLERKVHPDSRKDKWSHTLLHLAASSNNKKLARLLLQYKADPYLTQLINFTERHNAFDLEQGEPTGWLKKMYNDIVKKNDFKIFDAPINQLTSKIA